MKARKLVSATVASLGLVAGLSGFAGATSGSGWRSISDTGSHSYNAIKSHKSTSVKVKNDNDLCVTNNNTQHAYSGDVHAYDNTRLGDVSTGNARNTNNTNISATVNNSGSAEWAHVATPSGGSGAGGTISDTGYKSHNLITSKETTKVNVNNDNDIHITNNNTQTATSGDAHVSDNTRVGSVTTGDATNTNSTTVRLNVSN